MNICSWQGMKVQMEQYGKWKILEEKEEKENLI